MASDFPDLAPHDLAAAGQALFGAGWRAETARALGVSEREIARAELGLMTPPAEWRAKLIGLAQDQALRALETASNLLCPETEPAPSHPGSYPMPRYA